MSTVHTVSRSPTHSFSKHPEPEIRLLANFGVEGDAHAGRLVQHRYRVRKNPTASNLCQVHLIHHELLQELNALGFAIHPGEIGENIATQGIDLLALPQAAKLRIGPCAVVEVTGLREPCVLMNKLRPGLMKAVLDRTPDGTLIRRAGIMAVVLESGTVTPGDRIQVELPPKPHSPLGPV